MFGTIAKWATEIDDPARIPELVSRRFHTACNGRPGPVVIAVPEDMLIERRRGAGRNAFTPAEIWPGATDMSRLQTLLAAAKRPIVVAAAAVVGASFSALMRFADRFQLPVATVSAALICSTRYILVTPAISASRPIRNCWRA